MLTLDWDAIYTSVILPTFGVQRGGQTSPVWVFVGGQPGAGKTTLIRGLVAELGADCTQVISYDALNDRLLTASDLPHAGAVTKEEVRRVCPAFVDALIDRATSLRAHVVWERPVAADGIGLAHVARALGYRVELRVMAAPLLESWLATLRRDSAPALWPDDRVPLDPRRIAFDTLSVHYHRWPGFLAEVEEQRAVDAIQIIGRTGAAFFQNRLGPTGQWQGPVFAAESLLVERQAPRTRAAVQSLLDDWQTLIARPQIAFANHESWPHASIMALGQALAALRDDPSLDFDPNDPRAVPDPRAAMAWLARLTSDISAACAAADAPASLRPRTDRLLTMVTELFNPTRRA